MPTNQSTLLRQWHMLRKVPRYPSKATIQDIRATLQAEGFDVTVRTVQRDLNELSLIFPLVVDDREKPYGWSWQKDAPSFSLPSLSIPEAMALALAEQHLKSLLPTSVITQLGAHFDAAHLRLESERTPNRNRTWLDKVRTVSATQPLIPPKVLPEVHATVTEALLQEKQIQVKYVKKGANERVEYRLHPMALVQRGPMMYLQCRISDYEDFRMLAMNRIKSATLLDEPVSSLPRISLDEQIETGIWGYGAGKKMRIKLSFLGGQGDHLQEALLSKDQQIEVLAKGVIHLTATVADTPQLRWWILGMGDGVEVVSPTSLRNEIKKTVRSVLLKY